MDEGGEDERRRPSGRHRFPKMERRRKDRRKRNDDHDEKDEARRHRRRPSLDNDSRYHRHRDHHRTRHRSSSYSNSEEDDGSVDYHHRSSRRRRRRDRSKSYPSRRSRENSVENVKERNDHDDNDGEKDYHSRRRNRHRSPSLEEEHRSRKRRRRNRRRRQQQRRHRSMSSSRHLSPPVPPSPGQQQRRTGVVSDDESLTNPPIRRQASSASSRDDTIGHFRGGPGTLIADRYDIVNDVGMGTFGRVVECFDLRTRRRVAIKIVRNVKKYYDSAQIEANIVKDVNRRGGRGESHCAVLYHSFTWTSHFCMVFENLGPSLYDFVKRHNYQPFPMVCVRDFAQQLLEALEFIHSFRLIHTDLKPENILLTNYRVVPYRWRGRSYKIPESTKIKLIDFGGATYDDEKKSSVVNTRQYRAPEVILGVGWSTPSDMWSAGCILTELYLGELLFATHDNMEHLALIEATVGNFPRRLLKHAKNQQMVSEGFDSAGKHRRERVLSRDSAAYVRRVVPVEGLIRKEDGRFLDLLRRLLVIEPGDRATAHQCVRHRL